MIDNKCKDFPSRLSLAKGKLSARAFSTKVGVSAGAMNQYLSGKSEPTRPVLNAIASASGISIAWLLTGEGEMRPGCGDSAPSSGIVTRDLATRVFTALEEAYNEAGIPITLPVMSWLWEYAWNMSEVIIQDSSSRAQEDEKIATLKSQEKMRLKSAKDADRSQQAG